jgi:MFS superfamily sulfate permease-like transporter
MLPGLKVLSRYQRGWWRLNLMAGLTVGAMLIPQSMAYAELAGMLAEYGFYAVLGPLVVSALVGTSRHLGVGPEPGTASHREPVADAAQRRPGGGVRS